MTGDSGFGWKICWTILFVLFKNLWYNLMV